MNVTYSLFKILLLAFSQFCLSSYSLVLANPVIDSDLEAKAYLQKYGYIDEFNPRVDSLISEKSYSAAMREFQNFAGLDETGILDISTLEMMNTPRCGHKDKKEENATMSQYRRLGSTWNVQNLTYRVTKYSRTLKEKQKIDQDIAKAFQVWSDASPLIFTNKNRGQANINLRFELRNHGDGNPFDGPGFTLAHASDPEYGGDVCFDDEEPWTVNEHRGVNLFQVAAHEIGHSLGLGHSKVKNSLMAPFYPGYKPNFMLDNDDIKGIQRLYGKPPKSIITPTEDPSLQPTPDMLEAPDLCQESDFDAATRTKDRRVYVFKGDFYWRISKKGIDPDYPRRISADWGGIPGNIDAAFTWKNGKTFFFKDDLYWKFTNQEMENGYPRFISVGFEGIPNNIDAAFVWRGNGKTFFFKGDEFWVYDSKLLEPVSSKYPKPISLLDGVPSNISAALQWLDTRTYLFKNGEIYGLSSKQISINDADPPFPRSTSEWWLKCKSQYEGSDNMNKAALEDDDEKSVYTGKEDQLDKHHTTSNQSKESEKLFMNQYGGDPTFGFGYASASSSIVWNVFATSVLIATNIFIKRLM